MNGDKTKSKRDVVLGAMISIGQAVACAVCLLMLSQFTGKTDYTNMQFLVYGTLLFVGLNTVMMMYAKREIKKDFLKNFLVVQILLLCIVVVAEVMGIYISPYIVPYVFLGISVSSLISKQLALYVNALLGIEIILIGTLLGGVSGEVFVKALMTVIGGGLLILLQNKTDSRIKTITTAVCVMPLYVGILLVAYKMGIVKPESILFACICAANNAVIAVILTIGFLPIFEWVFKIITAYRVAELGDVSKGLLFELSQKAKGTYYHSVAVANITAECAAAIGEDAQLARVCAMYHDIGKVVEPVLFIENQNGDTGNPHDKMTPELSVALIRKHASDGAEILKKHRVPQILVDCALQHHGTLPIRYFYERAKKFSASEVDIEDYSYNNSKPTNKISALIMICDASEAAVRAKGSLKGDEVDAVVKSIIEERIMLEQFDECPITFADLHKIRETIVASFAGVMHKRINYPKFELGERK